MAAAKEGPVREQLRIFPAVPFPSHSLTLQASRKG